MQLHSFTSKTLHKTHSFSGSFEQPPQEVLKHDEWSSPQVRQIFLQVRKRMVGLLQERLLLRKGLVRLLQERLLLRKGLVVLVKLRLQPRQSGLALQELPFGVRDQLVLGRGRLCGLSLRLVRVNGIVVDLLQHGDMGLH